MVRLVAAKSCPLTKTVALPDVPYPAAELWLLTMIVLPADERCRSVPLFLDAAGTSMHMPLTFAVNV